MPSTGPEAAALAGLPYDETKYKNDASYNKALGLAYFQKQLQDNGGELSKAYAAYNAGPEALKQAVDEADKEGGDWLTYLPKETQKYVTGNMKAYASGEGKPPRATFEEIDAQLRSDPRIAGNPDRYKIARGDAKQRFEEQTQAIKQRDEDALANALKGVEQNGGRFSDLPPSVRAAVPVDKRDAVINYAQKVAKGDDTTSPWLYSKFSNDPSKDPHTGEPMSDSAFYRYRPELSDADFRKFTDERNKRTGKTAGSGGPGDLNSAAIKQNLDANLWNLGIKPNPKSDSENERVGAIRKFVDDYFVAAQREAGKKFTDAEVSTHLNNLFAKNETFKRFWSSDTKGPLLSMEIGDIPSGDKAAIKESFKKQGVSDPTDAQVLNAFFMSKVTK
jgi:soluble lytic murein transglycosylase